MADLNELITTVDKDRRVASEVLTKLPELVTAGPEEDVVFDIGEPVNVPSIAKLQAALKADDIMKLQAGIAAQSVLTQGLIQETGRLAAKMGISRATPNWTQLDLTPQTKEAKSDDPLYRAQIEDGIRFPYEGYLVQEPAPRYSDSCAQVGNYIIPKHTIDEIKRINGATSNKIDVHQYPAFTRTVTYTRTYWRWYYYGYYYYWWRRRYGYYYTYTYSRTVPGTPLNGSMVAQTFQVDNERVLLGLKHHAYTPGAYASAAKPKVLLVKAAYGMPNLDEVLAQGSYKEDSAYQSTASSPAYHLVTVEFDRPVQLQANESYAFVIVAEAKWEIHYRSNQESSGSLFYTEDGKFWSCDLAKDVGYTLLTADFGQDVERVDVELSPISLSGGVASIKTAVSATLPSEGDFGFEVAINDQWRDIGILSELNSLPPYTPVKGVFQGSRYSMPILNIQDTQITAFRPDTRLNFISLDRPLTGPGQVKIIYELAGFDPQYHEFAPCLKSLTGTRLEPLIQEVSSSTDQQVSTVSCVFDLAEEQTYHHEIEGTTATATRLFDVNSVIELSV